MDGHNVNGNRRFAAGRTSSLMVMLFTLSLVIVIVLSRWLTVESYKVTKEYVHSVLLCLMAVGLLGMAIMCLLRHNDRHVRQTDQRGHGQGRITFGYVRIHLPTICIHLFALGNIALVVMKIVDIVQCFKNMHEPKNVISLTFRTLQVIFVIVQLMFLRKFQDIRCISLVSRTITLFVFSANVAVWFYVLMEESADLFDPKSFGYGLNGPLNNQFQSECINGNTSLANTIKTANNYLYPFVTEYCLLAAGALFTIWDMNSMQDDQDRMNGQMHQVPFALDLVAGQDDGQPLLAPHPEQGSGLKCRFLFYFSLALCITDFVVSLLTKLLDENKEQLIIVSNCLELFKEIFLVLLSVIGFWLISKGRVRNAGFDSNAVLLIFSAFGVSLYSMFESMSCVEAVIFRNHFSVTNPSVRLVTGVFRLLSVFWQTRLLRKLGHFRLQEMSNRRRVWIQDCLAFIAVCNFEFWVTDSFIPDLIQITLDGLQTKIYGERNWMLLTNPMLPLVIFYRLHSTIISAETITDLHST